MSAPLQETWRPEAPRRLVVSFHDVAPHTRRVCAEFVAEALRRGVPRISLLVVPCYHGLVPMDQAPGFVDWLKRLSGDGHEMVLHGYEHQAAAVTGGPIARWMGCVYTQREGEFFRISRKEAGQKILRGLELFKRSGLPVHGFTPPAWLLSHEGREVLRQTGLSYSTALNYIDMIQSGAKVRAPTVVFSCRNRARRVLSLAWSRYQVAASRRAPVLRMAIHPADLAHPEIRACVWSLLGQLIDGREPCTYGELAGVKNGWSLS